MSARVGIGSHRTGRKEISQGIVFASRPRCSPETVLLEILRAAESGNTGHQLSGMLYYDPHLYLQVINGDDPALAQLWQNLQRDRRHDILWHVHLPAADRLFPCALPLGYASRPQVRALGHDLADFRLETRPAEEILETAVARLGSIARALYPSAFALGTE